MVTSQPGQSGINSECLRRPVHPSHGRMSNLPTFTQKRQPSPGLVLERCDSFRQDSHASNSVRIRPNFEGDKDSPGGGRRRSPVTNTYQTYYPDHKRKVR